MRYTDLGRGPIKPQRFEFENELVVNRSCYVPTAIRLEQYLSAGRKLTDYRDSVDWLKANADLLSEMALNDDPDIEEYVDDLPLYDQPGFDPADITAAEDRYDRIIRAARKQPEEVVSLDNDIKVVEKTVEEVKEDKITN